MTEHPALPPLAPLPYHLAIVAALRADEPEVWAWAASARARGEYAEQVRADLLKESYRLDADAHAEVHRCAAAAAARLGLDVPVTLYQRGEGAMNAALYFLPGEAHVVFTGAILERLRGAELEAVLGHELAHYLLWQLDDGAYHAADRILAAAAQDPRADASQLQTARLYRLYTEVFADRGGAVACGALLPAVCALVKTQTGMGEVSGAHYLKQADEICAPANLCSGGVSHPEIFIRARALRLWCEADAAAEDWLVAAMQGPLALDQLDWLGQERLSALTRRIIMHLLHAPYLRSPALLAHARRFFPDIQPAARPDARLAADLRGAPGVHAYAAYLLADFAAADRDLGDVALAAALELALALGLSDTFEPIALKELALTKRQLGKIKMAAPLLLVQAGKQDD
ncbi:M48 family metalloprotease [Janthinobacterium sp.]|uniref:M48 family metalloprotease n=1 Tax=Janthinobacterium sp. TaxID=1871054 RepID=UPI00293D8E1F|nr:M48 family metalloprotease [Janthinobacterium sp.]